MADWKEDFDYPKGGEGSPQAARAAFGEPEPWMRWESRDHTHREGGYGGFHFQDKDKPFVLHGGGFDDAVKYIGTYVSICPGGMPFLDENYILESLSGIKNLTEFAVFPDYVNLVKKSTGKKRKCLLYPTAWIDDLIPSEELRFAEHFKEYQRNMKELKEKADQTGYKIISENGEAGHLIAKIIEKNGYKVKINILFQGKGDGGREMFYGSYDIVFSIPDEIKPYADEIETSQLSLITFPVWLKSNDGYMILKNGLYLKRDP